MKVLWLTNTPSLSQDNSGSKLIAGGWIASLEKNLIKNENITLAIAFYSKKNIEHFQINSAKYYPICAGRERLLYRLKLWIMDCYISNRDIKEIISIISDFQPDIIHVHGTELGFAKITEYTNIPVVISIQGNLSVYQKMFFRGISCIDIFKYSCLKDIFEQILYWKESIKFIKRSIKEREILSRCKYIVGRTNWDRRIASILAPGAIYFHNDEILRDTFYEYNWEEKIIKNKKFMIHTTTSSPLYKGLETICETAFFLDNNTQLDFVWNIAGLNKDDFVVNLCKRKIQGKYFERRLKFLGKLHSADLVKYMLEADLFVTASHIENSSNSLCEAMILGMPCIASFAGGTDTILKSGVEGLLFQDGDPYSLAGTILELINNYSESVRLGYQAREKALKRHDKNKIVEDMVRIYSQITGKNN